MCWFASYSVIWHSTNELIKYKINTGKKVYSNLEHKLSKCFPCDFKYLICLEIHLESTADATILAGFLHLYLVLLNV
jgi:hypothetical protein